jgi:hypothetical protein
LSNFLSSLGALATGLAITLSMLAPAQAIEGRPDPKAASSVCDSDDDAPTDAFGFTDGSGIADLGRGSLGLTLNADGGVRRGRSLGRGAMLQGSYGLLPCLEVSPYLLGGTTRSQIERQGLKDKAYGGGFEARYRLLNHGRHGFGLTMGIDAGLERNESHGEGRFSTYNTTMRVLADKVLIPGTLHAAFNLSHNLIWSGPSPHERASTFTIGGALAWQVVEDVYLSGEVRHMRQHDTLGFGKLAGHATFVGPGIYWQATDQLAISLAYNVQVYGEERGQPGRLDLTNFSRHLVQMDIGWTF